MRLRPSPLSLEGYFLDLPSSCTIGNLLPWRPGLFLCNPDMSNWLRAQLHQGCAVQVRHLIISEGHADGWLHVTFITHKGRPHNANKVPKISPPAYLCCMFHWLRVEFNPTWILTCLRYAEVPPPPHLEGEMQSFLSVGTSTSFVCPDGRNWPNPG